MLQVLGVEDAMDAWQSKSRTSGVYSDFFDGAISHDLPHPDGSSFFKHNLHELPDGKLAIGLSLGVDWYVSLHSKLHP